MDGVKWRDNDSFPLSYQSSKNDEINMAIVTIVTTITTTTTVFYGTRLTRS